jgi:hypothetical protein
VRRGTAGRAAVICYLRRLASLAALALGGKEFGPGIDLGMLFQKHTALAHGHASPDTEVYSVVECVGQALGDDGTGPASSSGLALGRSFYEELFGIDGKTRRLRGPRGAGVGGAASKPAAHSVKVSHTSRMIHVFYVNVKYPAEVKAGERPVTGTRGGAAASNWELGISAQRAALRTLWLVSSPYRHCDERQGANDAVKEHTRAVPACAPAASVTNEPV